MDISRRSALVGLGSFFAWSYMPRCAEAAGGRDARYLVVLLRGGLDGLSAVIPVGDPHYEALRRTAGIEFLPLDGFFGLNPNLARLHQLFRAGDASIFHAVSTQYRGRSHFDGQDVLESGIDRSQTAETGWLNRALTEIPAGSRLMRPRGLAISASTPLILRGPAPVYSWQPKRFAEASPVTIAHLLDYYEATDPILAQSLRDAASLDPSGAGPESGPPGRRKGNSSFTAAANAAARLMSRADGPRIAVMNFAGWDTHVQQGQIQGTLGRQFSALDEAIDAFAKGLAGVWKDTVITIVTEFGRTAAINGSQGTDHGTATVAFQIGGAVRGGRVVADWPGLRPSDLFEQRDLRPTLDLRQIFKGVLKDLYGLGDNVLASNVFPGSGDVAALKDLIN